MSSLRELRRLEDERNRTERAAEAERVAARHASLVASAAARKRAEDDERERREAIAAKARADADTVRLLAEADAERSERLARLAIEANARAQAEARLHLAATAVEANEPTPGAQRFTLVAAAIGLIAIVVAGGMAIDRGNQLANARSALAQERHHVDELTESLSSALDKQRTLSQRVEAFENVPAAPPVVVAAPAVPSTTKPRVGHSGSNHHDAAGAASNGAVVVDSKCVDNPLCK